MRREDIPSPGASISCIGCPGVREVTQHPCPPLRLPPLISAHTSRARWGGRSPPMRGPLKTPARLRATSCDRRRQYEFLSPSEHRCATEASATERFLPISVAIDQEGRDTRGVRTARFDAFSLLKMGTPACGGKLGCLFSTYVTSFSRDFTTVRARESAIDWGTLQAHSLSHSTDLARPAQCRT